MNELKKPKVGDLVFLVRSYDDINTRQQQLTCYVDGGYLDSEDTVRRIDGNLIDHFDDELKWTSTKNQAIDELIKQLELMKD